MIIRKTLKKRGKFYFRKFPYSFTTKKPLEVRMGKGKGNHDQWICPIQPGQVILEFKLMKIPKLIIMYLIRQCRQRVPFKTSIISKKNSIIYCKKELVIKNLI